ncbi:MAG: copper chaperone PCu(A)C [Proteobacteria bacterium]|nr:copper chaperone PCu(A)C [Pseudomonadota bacterium]
MSSSFAIKFVAACALSAGAVAVFAQNAAPVEASGAWVRAAVPGQSGTGAFMKLTSQTPLKLVGVATPVAGVAEVHEMKMEGDTMKMRAIPGIDLPARQAVELKPGGYHLMLMDLKQPIKAGSSVPLTLTFEDAKGVKSTLALQAPVQTAAPGMAGHKH